MSEQTAEKSEATDQKPAADEAKPDTEQQSNADDKLKELEAERDKWQGLARKHEERAKSNAEKAKGFDDLKASQMTEQEKAVETARTEARTEVLREVAPQLVRLKFEAVSAGRLSDEQLDNLLEDVDMTKYLTETGEVDSERVTKKVDALAPKDAKPVYPDLGQGVRPPAQVDPGPGISRLRHGYAQSAKK